MKRAPAPVVEAERLQKMADRITEACTRWGWSHCTTEKELIAQIDHLISLVPDVGAAEDRAEAERAVRELALIYWQERGSTERDMLFDACDNLAKARETGGDKVCSPQSRGPLGLD